MYVCVCVCVYIYIYIYTHTHMKMALIYIYIYIYIYMYIYIYIAVPFLPMILFRNQIRDILGGETGKIIFGKMRYKFRNDQ